MSGAPVDPHAGAGGWPGAPLLAVQAIARLNVGDSTTLSATAADGQRPLGVTALLGFEHEAAGRGGVAVDVRGVSHLVVQAEVGAVVAETLAKRRGVGFQ